MCLPGSLVLGGIWHMTLWYTAVVMLNWRPTTYGKKQILIVLNTRNRPGHSKGSKRRRRKWQREMVEPFKRECCRFGGSAGQEEGLQEGMQGIGFFAALGQISCVNQPIVFLLSGEKEAARRTDLSNRWSQQTIKLWVCGSHNPFLIWGKVNW